MMPDRVAESGVPPGGLLSLENYCVITFPNTHSALKAEKTLQGSEDLPFVIMPVPRMISSGCGLAVKIFPGTAQQAMDLLRGGAIEIDGLYSIDKAAGSVEKLM